MMRHSHASLLPEEDALDDLDDEDESDPTVPGDLWFRVRRPEGWKGRRILKSDSAVVA
jgi:hypothetical protein